MKFSVNTIYYFLLKATHPSITVTVLHFFWKANRTNSAMLLRILRLATGTELSPCFCFFLHQLQPSISCQEGKRYSDNNEATSTVP